jgi:flagellar protein FliO/FliZ
VRRRLRFAFVALAACSAGAVLAADTKPVAGVVPGFDATGLIEMMLSLLLVIALIIGLSWGIGRLRGVTRTSSSAMTVIAEAAIGPKERVVLVRIGDRQALVGISGGAMSSLTLLEQNITVPETPALPEFAQRLKEVMKRSGLVK